jgi:hypothetical protein
MLEVARIPAPASAGWRDRTRRLAPPFLVCVAVTLAALPEARGIKDTRGAPAVEAKQHPEAVLVTAKSRGQKTGSCCGALIAPRLVLTAGHCIVGFDEWEITAPYAREGRVRARSATGKTLPPHGNPHDRPEDDLGLLVLERPIDLGPDFPRLYEGDLLPLETKLLVIGRMRNGVDSGGKLYQARVTLVPLRGTLNLYGGHPETTEQGDSGGPVYVAGKEREIVAICSAGAIANRSQVNKDVFVPIERARRKWILEQIKNTPRQ